MRLLRGLWNALTAARNITANLIFLAIVAFILVAIFSHETVTVPDKAALVVDPTGNIVEQKRAIDPLSSLLSSNRSQEPETLLRNIEKAITKASTDNRIKALVLNLDDLDSASMSMLQELGDTIDAFKISGKRVYAFGSAYTQTQYYLAAHADEVYIDKHAMPAIGGVFLPGFGVYPTFFKSALDKLKINFHIFRVGQYKSAVEPLMRDNMSDAAKQENLSWLGVLWDAYETSVVKQRGMTRATFDAYTNHYDEELGQADNDPSKVAVKDGFVDELISRQEFDTRMKAVVGGDDSGYSNIDFRDYL
ncbi:MAG TPA: S49 family peptidase, partial [Pseudomonadales bacterium]|nr:S49 family peptidase [Pseudomonadales bacterium]